MLEEQQYFQANERGIGAGSWQSLMAQQFYDAKRNDTEGNYPWDLSVYFGFCEKTPKHTAHDKLFDVLYDNEQDALDAIAALPAYDTKNTSFAVKYVTNNDAPSYIGKTFKSSKVVFDGVVARRVRSVRDHKNGYALYFKFVSNTKKKDVLFMKLTTKHDYYTPFDDNFDFENVESYIINDIPLNGRPAYEYIVNNFNVNSDLVLDKSTLDPEKKVNYKAVEKENKDRKKLLDQIKNIKSIANLKEDMPDYYDGCKQIDGEWNSSNDRGSKHDHWDECDGIFYGRITYRLFKEYMTKHKGGIWEHNYDTRYDCELKDTDIINIKIRGAYKVWVVGMFPSHHCCYDSKKVYFSDALGHFADWTVEHQLGMDLVDKAVISAREDPLVEIDTTVHDDIDWLTKKVDQKYYGKYRFYYGQHLTD